MFFWTFRPESSLGWVFIVLAAVLTVYAVVVIVRDARARGWNGWDVAALAFVLLGGPGAALVFVAAHDFLELRARRKIGREPS